MDCVAVSGSDAWTTDGKEACETNLHPSDETMAVSRRLIDGYVNLSAVISGPHKRVRESGVEPTIGEDASET